MSQWVIGENLATRNDLEVSGKEPNLKACQFCLNEATRVIVNNDCPECAIFLCERHFSNLTQLLATEAGIPDQILKEFDIVPASDSDMQRVAELYK